MFTRHYIQAQNWAQTDMIERIKNEERGEIASWKIVLLFLVLAAGAARDQIGPKIDTAITDIVAAFG